MAVLQGLVRVSSSSPPSGWRSPTLSVTSVLLQCLSRWPASSSLHTFPSIAALLKRAMWQCSSPLAALVEIPHCHGSGQWQTLVTSYKMVRTSCSQLDGHSSHHLSRADRIITFFVGIAQKSPSYKFGIWLVVDMGCFWSVHQPNNRLNKQETWSDVQSYTILFTSTSELGCVCYFIALTLVWCYCWSLQPDLVMGSSESDGRYL